MSEDDEKIELSLMIKMWLLENKTFYQGWRVHDDMIFRGSWCFFDISGDNVYVALGRRKKNDEPFNMHDPMFFAKLGARIMTFETELTPTLGSLGIL